jgi:3'-5' exonuclease
MSNYIPLEKILFLDIETVPQTYEYAKLDEKTKELFNAKNRFAQNEEKSFEMIYNEKGGILSEFGKIICISIGMIHKTTLGRSMRLKSFAHDDEETLLKQFKKLLDDH